MGLMVARILVLMAVGLMSFAAPALKPVDHIDYIAWDGPGMRWSARIADDGKSFLCAPAGDWKRARPQTMLNYVAQNGTEWSAEIKDGRFVNAALGANISFESSEMIYRSWDGTAYSIRLDLKNKRFLQEPAPPHR
jgi:hypothetical protein